MFNIAIIEDDLALRKSLSNHFANSTQVDCVLVVENVDKFVKFHRDFMGVDLVLLDVMLNKQSSIKSIPLIQQRVPEAEIVMYTMMDDSETIFQALCNGATGYLLKDHNFDELEQRIVATLSGQGALLSPAVAKKVIKYFITVQREVVAPSSEFQNLSEREVLIIQLLKEGASYQEISNKVEITLNGVRYYIKNIYRKLQIKSKRELWKNNSVLASIKKISPLSKH
jgi:DNA-binding NarL/FixJ family response regulator